MYSHRSCHVSVFRPLCPLRPTGTIQFLLQVLLAIFIYLVVILTLLENCAHQSWRCSPRWSPSNLHQLWRHHVRTRPPAAPSVAQLAIVFNRPASRPLLFAYPNGKTMWNRKSLTENVDLFVSNAVLSRSSPHFGIYRDDAQPRTTRTGVHINSPHLLSLLFCPQHWDSHLYLFPFVAAPPPKTQHRTKLRDRRGVGAGGKGS
jgi:hypothetical protein